MLPRGKGRAEKGSGSSSEEDGAGVGWLNSPHKSQSAKGKAKEKSRPKTKTKEKTFWSKSEDFGALGRARGVAPATATVRDDAGNPPEEHKDGAIALTGRVFSPSPEPIGEGGEVNCYMCGQCAATEEAESPIYFRGGVVAPGSDEFHQVTSENERIRLYSSLQVQMVLPFSSMFFLKKTKISLSPS
jgi:hypothetical protein